MAQSIRVQPDGGVTVTVARDGLERIPGPVEKNCVATGFVWRTSRYVKCRDSQISALLIQALSCEGGSRDDEALFDGPS